MPLLPWTEATATNLVGKGLTELTTPVANGFVGNENTSIQHHLLNVPVAKRERVVEPDAVANDLGWETVTVV